MHINWIRQTKSESDLYFKYKTLKLSFKTVFLVQNNLLDSFVCMWIHKGWFVVKKLVLNDDVKTFGILLKSKTLPFQFLCLIIAIYNPKISKLLNKRD